MSDWDIVTSGGEKRTRQQLYRFLLNDPEEVRELLRFLYQPKASQMLDLLIRADNRRLTKILEEKKEELSEAVAK